MNSRNGFRAATLRVAIQSRLLNFSSGIDSRGSSGLKQITKIDSNTEELRGFYRTQEMKDGRKREAVDLMFSVDERSPPPIWSKETAVSVAVIWAQTNGFICLAFLQAAEEIAF
uniref:Uncharacterized protein n=1 Tax=Cucumis melo TaxID=3656 RepID=A0A9I9DAL6_CUCME